LVLEGAGLAVFALAAGFLAAVFLGGVDWDGPLALVTAFLGGALAAVLATALAGRLVVFFVLTFP
jgi:hypothetical protein